MRVGSGHLAAAICASVFALSSPSVVAQPEASPSSAEARTNAILACLSKGEEAVLLKEGTFCKPYREGTEFLVQNHPETPFNFDLNQACANLDDQRHLPPDIIKKIVSQKETSVAPSGIRIIGAVFCKSLDLVGLEIPYSLVIDRSIFAKGISARSFRTKADLSIDDGLVLGSLWLVRAQIDGTVFASRSFIAKMHVLESDIKHSLLFRTSVLSNLEIDSLNLAGELSVRDSVLSRLLIQGSRIGGMLDLSGSQVRCAYQIKANDIGNVAAVRVGLGKLETRTHDPQENRTLYTWRTEKLKRVVEATLGQPQVKQFLAETDHCMRAAEAEPAGEKKPDPKPEFLLLDNRIRFSLCLREFQWLGAGADGMVLPSHLTVNDLNVAEA
jgi:hypothetical protein